MTIGYIEDAKKHSENTDAYSRVVGSGGIWVGFMCDFRCGQQRVCIRVPRTESKGISFNTEMQRIEQMQYKCEKRFRRLQPSAEDAGSAHDL